VRCQTLVRAGLRPSRVAAACRGQSPGLGLGSGPLNRKNAFGRARLGLCGGPAGSVLNRRLRACSCRSYKGSAQPSGQLRTPPLKVSSCSLSFAPQMAPIPRAIGWRGLRA
jgi:hypothetical protein